MSTNKPRKHPRTCSVVGCETIHYARGFCHKHYKRDETLRYQQPYTHENKIDIFDDRAEVIINSREQQFRSIIDLRDVDMIRSFKWCITDNGYAITNYYGTMIRMHTMIFGRTGIDHINGNRLDNRLSNLRSADSSQNNRHRTVTNNATGYKGVSIVRGRYRAIVTLDGRSVYCGSRDTPDEAANLYDQFAIQIHGDFVHTNFTYDY